MRPAGATRAIILGGGRQLEMKNGRSAQLPERFTVRFSSFKLQTTQPTLESCTIEYGDGRPPFTQPRY
jgi:hypothetical protein